MVVHPSVCPLVCESGSMIDNDAKGSALFVIGGAFLGLPKIGNVRCDKKGSRAQQPWSQLGGKFPAMKVVILLDTSAKDEP